MYTEADQIKSIVDDAEKIVIVQADNPDGDSLGSALALEHLLGDLGKKPYLYCAVDIPTYLRYVPGWDRVTSDLPRQFDASIIVDASTMTLLERLNDSQERNWLAARPCIVLDHHGTVDNLIPFAKVTINDPKRSSAGELIYLLAGQLGWQLSVEAQECLAASILSDTQGLTNQLASAETYRIMGDMIEHGVDRPKLEEMRRELSKMPPEIYRYKATLISRSEFSAKGRIAHVSVPYSEITQYSPLYNPAPLIQADMLQTSGVLVAIVFKVYSDGRITAAIRCNSSAPIGSELAEHFGGGGHTYASGFKITDGRSFEAIQSDCLAFAEQLLDKLKND